MNIIRYTGNAWVIDLNYIYDCLGMNTFLTTTLKVVLEEEGFDFRKEMSKSKSPEENEKINQKYVDKIKTVRYYLDRYSQGERYLLRTYIVEYINKKYL